MNPTTLAYMDNQYTTQGSSTLLGQRTHEDGRTSLILDESLFYPQGGGQPADTGTITGEHGAFTVTDVRFIDGLVHHYGTLEGKFTPRETVNYTINQTRRHLHSRLHTAGHLIDEAVHNLGHTWQATKGIHFPGQAAVEYSGELENPEAAALAIETELNRLIQSGFETSAFFAPKSELSKLCHFVLPNMPENKPTRVVIVWGSKGIPCGGTHVKNIQEVGSVVIRKIKSSKGTIKVSYALEDENA